MEDAIVIVRSSAERTERICRNLVLGELPEDRLYTVQERPFSAAVRRCYEIGISSGANWIITVDADVLLRRGALEGLLREAKRMPRRYFQIEGMVLDKLMHRFRWASHRCYRGEYLPLALDVLSEASADLRPESTTIRLMESLGYGARRSHRLYGVHDFEQFYVDIYRKALVHAAKHPQWAAEMFSIWKATSASDPDSCVALRGAVDGLTLEIEARADVEHYRAPAQCALSDLGLAEKAAMSDISSQVIEKWIESFRAAPNVQRFCGPRPYKWRERIWALQSCYGLVQALPYVLGAMLRQAGESMVNYSERHKRWPD